MSAYLRRAWPALYFLATISSFASAAFIGFENCLSPQTQDEKPLQLQWVPLFVDAKFDTTYPNNLRFTFYGNVSGQQFRGPYPAPDSPAWKNDNDPLGKITNVGTGNKFSTLFSDTQVLSYNAWQAHRSKFCDHLTQGSCPLGPRFFANPQDPSELAAFEIDHNFDGPYEFSTLSSKIYMYSGDTAKQLLLCITTNVTPYLGSSISNMLTWLPAAILIFQGIAVLSAAIWSPWGSSDIFRWSSNYGRHEELLRLVTPGFGDCLQYIQFVTLMGSLTLQYPGFFQPAVSRTAWSLLLFNESWVSNGPGTQSLVDGIYTVNGTYGIDSIRQLIGMSESIDVWACMAIWLAIIIGIIIVLTQVGFFSRWVHRLVTKTSEQDLRKKNLPFTIGNMIRLLYNFFILPIIALSLFQLVIAPRSPKSVVAVAALFLALWIISAAWILRVIFSTRPRTHLFDDMPTLLLYGPLYNTYSDSAAPFAFIPIVLTFMRGIAFGAAQPSGTAQLIILAVCEIILIVTLNGFRPFMNQTSMNAYHTFFAAARFVTVVLSITFIDSLNVSEGSRGWVGYTILLIHACVLVFGFFLNSLQTVVEVIARSMGLASGAGGSILSWRMLKKRQDRPATPGSNAAMLRENDELRHRSMSTSSQQLLNQGGATPSSHRISGLDNISNGEDPGESPMGGYSYVPAAYGAGSMQGIIAAKHDSGAFYRPPRKRTMTNEALNPVVEARSEDSPRHTFVGAIPRSATSSPRPPFLRDRADSGSHSVRTDYAVREVDQYYRGPALNEQQTRKLKTGPADPNGPAANAQGWIQGLWFGLFGGSKRKERDAGKGFEVVRSSRMPPEMQQEIARQEELELQEKRRPDSTLPYRDSPDLHQDEYDATGSMERPPRLSEADVAERPRRSKEGFDFGFDANQGTPSTRAVRADSAAARNVPLLDPSHPGIRAEQPSNRPVQGERLESPSYDIGLVHTTQPASEEELSGTDSRRYSDMVPSLAPVDTGDDINMPSFSRISSQRSSDGSQADAKWHRRLNRDYSQREYSQRTSRQVALPTRGPSDASHAASEIDGESNHLHRPDTIESFDGNDHMLTVPDADERPSSVLNTSHHRAADSIMRNSFGANAALQGSSAEIVPGSFTDAEAGEGGFLRRES